MKRANRVAITRTETGYQADFYKTHNKVGTFEVTDAEWQPSEDANKNKAREEFRAFAVSHAEDIEVDWKPELQQQAWDRKYWKYETDQMVEEDAIELMRWTIMDTCKKCKYDGEVTEIALDGINPVVSKLTYVEDGKYAKNGNWASAQVDLDVEMVINGTPINIIWTIEMVSGQLKKIKLTKSDIDQMVADAGAEELVG